MSDKCPACGELRKVSLQRQLAAAQDERDALKAGNARLQACHEAELGVCEQHCDVVQRLQAEAGYVVGQWDGERCQRCGRGYQTVWIADDALWLQIVGHEGGVMCPACFTAACREHGITLQWFASDLTTDGIARLQSDYRGSQQDNARLQAIVDKLPKTADGVPVTLGMRLWSRPYVEKQSDGEEYHGKSASDGPVHPSLVVFGGKSGWSAAHDVSKLYSSEDAATAAGEERFPDCDSVKCPLCGKQVHPDDMRTCYLDCEDRCTVEGVPPACTNPREGEFCQDCMERCDRAAIADVLNEQTKEGEANV